MLDKACRRCGTVPNSEIVCARLLLADQVVVELLVKIDVRLHSLLPLWLLGPIKLVVEEALHPRHIPISIYLNRTKILKI